MLVLASLGLMLAVMGCTSQPAKEHPGHDDFDKKLKCAGMLEKLQEDAEHDQFKAESYVQNVLLATPQCMPIAEKYTLYVVVMNKRPRVDARLTTCPAIEPCWSSIRELRGAETGMSRPTQNRIPML